MRWGFGAKEAYFAAKDNSSKGKSKATTLSSEDDAGRTPYDRAELLARQAGANLSAYDEFFDTERAWARAWDLGKRIQEMSGWSVSLSRERDVGCPWKVHGREKATGREKGRETREKGKGKSPEKGSKGKQKEPTPEMGTQPEALAVRLEILGWGSTTLANSPMPSPVIPKTWGQQPTGSPAVKVGKGGNGGGTPAGGKRRKLEGEEVREVKRARVAALAAGGGEEVARFGPPGPSVSRAAKRRTPAPGEEEDTDVETEPAHSPPPAEVKPRKKRRLNAPKARTTSTVTEQLRVTETITTTVERNSSVIFDTDTDADTDTDTEEDAAELEDIPTSPCELAQSQPVPPNGAASEVEFASQPQTGRRLNDSARGTKGRGIQRTRTFAEIK